VILAMMPIQRWDATEKDSVARLIRAKGSSDEALYLKLMQAHEALRSALIQLGS
jgi:hypothetical protein